MEALGLGFLDTDDPNYRDNMLHTAVKRPTKSNPSVFRTKNLLAAIASVQVAHENSLDLRLLSHFLIYKNSALNCKTSNLTLRGARDTDIEFMNCMIEEVTSIAKSMIK